MNLLWTSLFRPIFLSVFVATLFFVSQNNVCADELTEENYQMSKGKMSVVLVAVNWGRQWGCGKYENAQLVSLTFELFPNSSAVVDGYSSLELKTPSRLFIKPEFVNHAFILTPGQYALTSFSVKAAKSRNDVGHFNATKKDLVKEGIPNGGTFTIGAGEVVYIDNFFLDCYYNPVPWRYYSEGRDGFSRHVAEFKQQYKFLGDKEVTYRHFKTKNFGNDYELP